METPQKMATYVDAPQLDMASQCCLVAVSGFCVATSSLVLKRREDEKTG